MTTASIAEQWQDWPRSFCHGVRGAANIGGELYVFKEGWYMAATNPQSRALLTNLKGWPAGWDGTLEAVVQIGPSQAFLVKDSQGVKVDFSGANPVASGPVPISSVLPQGITTLDAGFLAASGEWLLFNGTEVSYGLPSASLQTGYAGAVFSHWPALWNPVLNHAPAGRAGNLWVATTQGDVIRHDGDSWQLASGSNPAHLVLFRPGHKLISIIKTHPDGSFTTAYTQDQAPQGTGSIGGWTLDGPADEGLAFDFKGSGCLDHLVFFTPGKGQVSILKNQGNGGFAPVYTQADSAINSGIGGYDLANGLDRGFAMDCGGKGCQNSLVFYRPATGAIFFTRSIFILPAKIPGRPRRDCRFAKIER